MTVAPSMDAYVVTDSAKPLDLFKVAEYSDHFEKNFLRTCPMGTLLDALTPDK